MSFRDVGRMIGAVVLAYTLGAGGAGPAAAQIEVDVPRHPPPPGEQGSPNMDVVAHIPLGAQYTISDVEIEQEMHRPYAYVGRLFDNSGFDIIDLSEPENARVIYRWRIDNPELHQGRGAMDNKYFKLRGRYYFIQSVQFSQGGPDSEVGAIVFDMTGLPDTSTVAEVGRIVAPDVPGGFHNIYAYKHSDGRALLFATSGSYTKIYDLEKFLDGDAEQGLIGRVPVPETPGALSSGYHDFYVGYDPFSEQDKFYGGGGGGYYVFDVSRPEEPELLFTVTGVPGVAWGHTFTPTPDGRYAVGETEFQYQPLRVFDMKSALDGEVGNIDAAVGAWHADWRTVAHNHELRWPFVFVSAYEAGLAVFNMMDPTYPYTVAYYDTFDGPHNVASLGGPPRRPGSPFTWGVYDGAWGVDIRNVDGLIVVSDMTTGFWAFRMEGFQGWNGNDWGMPNISSVQDWENGPVEQAWRRSSTPRP